MEEGSLTKTKKLQEAAFSQPSQMGFIMKEDLTGEFTPTQPTATEPNISKEKFLLEIKAHQYSASMGFLPKIDDHGETPQLAVIDQTSKTSLEMRQYNQATYETKQTGVITLTIIYGGSIIMGEVQYRSTY